MASRPSVVIPRQSRPSSNPFRAGTTAKDRMWPSWRPRTYSEGPLPVAPSDSAHFKAHIVRRTDNDHGPLYHLRIGETELSDVDLDEILDYVSPRDLEEFENANFVEEREILKVVEAARREEERRMRADRISRRANSRTAMDYESTDQSTGSSSSDEGEEPIATGRNGRPRPTYTHLYAQVSDRPRNSRAMYGTKPLRRSNIDDRPSSSSEDTAAEGMAGITVSNIQQIHLTSRKSLMRDEPTGTLMTSSLQGPAGPIEESRAVALSGTLPSKHLSGEEDKPQIGASGSALQTSSFFKDLSISEERHPKRARLGSQSVTGPKPHEPILPKATKLRVSQPLTDVLKTMTVDLTGSDSESDYHEAAENPSGAAWSTVSPVRVKDEIRSTKTPEKDSAMMVPGSSPQADLPTSITRPSATPIRTSIINPSATPQPYFDAMPLTTDAEEQSTGSDDDVEFDIESILKHGLSDPKTHPSDLGDKPVLLYLVKWVGYEEPTWEPLESFGDLQFVNAYHKQHGLEPVDEDRLKVDNVDDDAAMYGSQDSRSRQSYSEHATNPNLRASLPPSLSGGLIEEDEEDVSGDDVYEMEGILAHHWSDPRTHRPDQGRKPIMLYEVKWKGYDETTWEPAESFDDDDFLRDYRRKAGLK